MKNITTEKEYDESLKRADEIFMAEPNTPEAEELDELCEAIEKYEDEKYPID